MCASHCAFACRGCVSEAEQTLRARGVVRCSYCEKYDLIVRGAARVTKGLFDCGTCSDASWQATNNGRPTLSRGSCSSCHHGRICPICAEYCMPGFPRPPRSSLNNIHNIINITNINHKYYKDYIIIIQRSRVPRPMRYTAYPVQQCGREGVG